LWVDKEGASMRGESRLGFHTMLRILVVDDQIYVRHTISLMLKSTEFEVIEAGSGREALTKFEESKFDLAIVDIYMPGMDGVKIIKSLRKNTPNLPVIAISGRLLNRSELSALDFFSLNPELSNVICISKPVRPNQLIETIHKAIGMDAVATAAP
jgi:CheY-like chemotaxis protein